MRFSILGLCTGAFLFSCSAAAVDAGLDVFRYECAQIDSDETGFECDLREDEGLLITLTKKRGSMTEEMKGYSEYRANKLIMRFFQVGGENFVVAADFWEDKQKRCWADDEDAGLLNKEGSRQKLDRVGKALWKHLRSPFEYVCEWQK